MMDNEQEGRYIANAARMADGMSTPIEKDPLPPTDEFILKWAGHKNFGTKGGEVIYRVFHYGERTEVMLHKRSGGSREGYPVTECYLILGEEKFDMLPHPTNDEAMEWLRKKLAPTS